MALSLPSFMRRASPPLLGIDLSSSSVKVVELVPGQKAGIRLQRYAIESVERGAIADGNVENPDQVAEALARALRRMGTRTREAALALPSSAVITKRIALPAGLGEEDYELQVESEASQYIPFAIEEVNLDFQILGPAPGNPDEVEILIAASRKEKVEDRVAVAEMCGLRPVVMDIDSYAARSALDHVSAFLPNNGQGLVLAVFDIGSSATHLSIVLNGQTIFEREQAFGGMQLTQDLVRLYGLTVEEAEVKKKTGELPENYQSDVLQPFIEQGVADVARALQFFFTSTPYTRVDRIFLAGGSAVVPGLVEAIAEAHPGADRDPQPVPGHGDRRDDPREAVAPRCAGAAHGLRSGDAEVRRMIRINLLPHREMRRERRKKDFVGLLLLTFIVSAGVSLLVAFGISGQIDTQQARNDFITQENAKLDEQIKKIATLREEIDSLRARQQAVENLQRDRTIPVHVLDELVRYTPEGIFFKQLRQEERKITLVGVAQSNESVSNFMDRITLDAPWLENPDLGESSAGTLGPANARDPRRVFEFTMSAMIKAPAAPDDKAATKPVAAGPAPVAAAASTGR